MKKTTDALEILDKLYIKEDPKLLSLIEEERIKGDIAQKVYDLRKSNKMTQTEFAEKIGTTTRDISNIEEACGYRQHFTDILHEVEKIFGKIPLDK